MSRTRVGYRFMPFDEEMITHFLKHKLEGNDSVVDDDVHEIDLCKHEPWDLPRLCANEESHDQTWYFFCKREKNKSHQRRITEAGYWKSTGQDRHIKNKVGKEIGTKKTLRFYIGRPPNGELTVWTIHEYNSSSVLPHQTHFVLCKLMKKNAGKADAFTCHGKPLENPPSNNGNGRSEISVVDQEGSPSRDIWDSLRLPEIQQLDPTKEVMLSFMNREFNGSINNGYLNESTGLRSSSDFGENELWLANSFLNLPDECSPSAVFLQAALQEATPEAQGAVGDFIEDFIDYDEIYENDQEFSESSSSSSTTPQQDIHFAGQVWPGSNGYSTKNRSANRSQLQNTPSNKSAWKIRKPVAIHFSRKKNSDDSSKMKRILSEPEKDQTMVVAAASSKLRTFMRSFIQDPPFVYIAIVLVGLVLFVVISREMLIFH